jgi:hypothetical protein
MLSICLSRRTKNNQYKNGNFMKKSEMMQTAEKGIYKIKGVIKYSFKGKCHFYINFYDFKH